MWMSKRKRVAALFAAVAATAALAVPVVAVADHPGQTVEIKSTISINPYGNAGKVTATNANCVEQRRVVIKQTGQGKIGAATTNAKGGWQAEPKYKGALPYKIYAEVKPLSQGTPGTIYKCLGATSKVRVIAGG
jgi:hypothetical protein